MFKDLLSRFERFFLADLSYGSPNYEVIPYISCDSFSESIISFREFISGLSLTEEGYLVKDKAPGIVRARFSLESRNQSLEKLLFDVDAKRTSIYRIPAELFFGDNKVVDSLSFDGRAFYFVKQKNEFYERVKKEFV